MKFGNILRVAILLLFIKNILIILINKYLKLVDLSLIYIRSSQSKVGCSPTKLAELLGMGVPVIANSGVGDLDEILSMEANNSSCLKSFKLKDIEDSLSKFLDKRIDKTRIRDFALKNFSLEVGINRYQEVYKTLSLD